MENQYSIKRVKYVFVILVYKNMDDLKECIESIQSKVESKQIIVVNAYYDEKSRLSAESIANMYNADFINIENKGYSYGNNRGIELANSKYDYSYIVISNPDIIIERFDDKLLDFDFEYDLIAPQIITASGRKQNPMIVKRGRIREYLIYLGLKYNIKLAFYWGIIMSKISRLFYQTLYNSDVFQVFAAHGSFVILSKRAIEKLSPVYDENIFLFAEEGVLAMKALHAKLKTCYYTKICIMHKEDGSMKLSNLIVNNELKKSNIYFYEKYVSKKSI